MPVAPPRAGAVVRRDRRSPAAHVQARRADFLKLKGGRKAALRVSGQWRSGCRFRSTRFLGPPRTLGTLGSWRALTSRSAGCDCTRQPKLGGAFCAFQGAATRNAEATGELGLCVLRGRTASGTSPEAAGAVCSMATRLPLQSDCLALRMRKGRMHIALDEARLLKAPYVPPPMPMPVPRRAGRGLSTPHAAVLAGTGQCNAPPTRLARRRRTDRTRRWRGPRCERQSELLLRSALHKARPAGRLQSLRRRTRAAQRGCEIARYLPGRRRAGEREKGKSLSVPAGSRVSSTIAVILIILLQPLQPPSEKRHAFSP